MVSVSKISNSIQLAISLLPLVFSIAFLINQSWIALLLFVLSLFIIVGTIPLFRRRESLYMFLLVAIAGLPINIRLSFWLIYEEFISLDFFVGDILLYLVFGCVLFSVEEIVFGVITRLIWKKQYKIKI